MILPIQKLSEKLKPNSCEQSANAAVALIIRLDHRNPSILFVKRVQNARDLWSGQMALPGGKREVRDRNLEETVVRETMEETNIDLVSSCRFLGVMSTFNSIRRPEMSVLPFVILANNELPIRLNATELEEYKWISVEDLIRSRSPAKFSFGETPAYITGNTVIWGLTYRIVENLIASI